MLEDQNPKTEFGEASRNGVFDVDAEQSLTLLVDFKLDPHGTFDEVERQLEPLRQRGWLTHFNGSDVIRGPVTVVGTGRTPFEKVIANETYRDIFMDAPLNLFSAKTPHPESKKYNYTNSYYASGDLYDAVGFPWLGRYTDAQIEKMRDHIEGAQQAGLVTRYWNTPGWPVGLRNYVWTTLVKAGADIVNADDIKAVSKEPWGTWG